MLADCLGLDPSKFQRKSSEVANNDHSGSVMGVADEEESYGVNMENVSFFKCDFEDNGSMERVTLFLNLSAIGEGMTRQDHSEVSNQASLRSVSIAIFVDLVAWFMGSHLLGEIVFLTVGELDWSLFWLSRDCPLFSNTLLVVCIVSA
nr:DNA polymerase alpha catalytic subunit [Tanacetum cinerariifolium]